MSLYRLFTCVSQWSYVLKTASLQARRKLEVRTRFYMHIEALMKCRRSLAVILCMIALPFAQMATAKVVRSDSASQFNIPMYSWFDDARTPSAVVLAIHGLALHGTAYDRCARQLAADGVLFVAPDLRGYGSCHSSHSHMTAQYRDSEDDLIRLSQVLRRQNPDVPLFLVGESLGGALALRLASRNPNLYDGMILAAPAIRHRYHISLRSAADTAMALVMPRHEIDFSPYIRNYFSDEPAIVSEQMDDPLVRKTLRLGEILSSCRLIAGTTDSIRRLPPNLPLLIIQGQNDLMIGRRSLSLLQENLPGNRTKVQMFHDRGHILLETSHVHPEVLATVKNWIDLECSQPLLSRRASRGIASNVGISDSLAAP